jgi:hypothetical protein
LNERREIMKRLIVAVTVALMFHNSISSLAETETMLQTPPPVPIETLTAADQDSTSSSESVVSESPVAQNQVLLEFEVYRVEGDISFEATRLQIHPLPPDTVAEENAGSTKGSLLLFTAAKLRLGGVSLVADATGWRWSGKDLPPQGSGIERIASPKIMVLVGQAFQLEIGSREPIEYFERRADGLFEFRKSDEVTGLKLSCTVEKGKDECLILRDLTIKLASIENRVPIEGVSLDVGQPIVRTQESVFTVAIKLDECQGMLLRSERYGSLLIRLRVSSVQPDNA